jgi:hypothetical protein
LPAVDSENLPGPLAHAQAVYRDAAGQLPPATGEMLAERAGHFAAGVRLSLDAPQAMRRLHQMTGSLREVPSLSTLLPRVLDAALSLAGADFGNIQLLDPVTGSLQIVTQSGFDRAFLDHFAVVDDAHTACGRAARDRAQTVIPDVNTDPDFAPHRDIADASGFRAIQSTPLVDYAGRLLGMISTHFRRPHRPPEMSLRVMELYADFAGQAVAGHLTGPGGDGRGDPVGRAVISALLDPGDGELGAMPFRGSRPGEAGGQRGAARQSATQEGAMSQFAGLVVNRLFSVGMSLESARSLTGQGPAANRITQAADEIDHLIQDIRTTVFDLAADHPPERRSAWPPASARDFSPRQVDLGPVDSRP